VHLKLHWITVWWKGGARRQPVLHQHSAAPCMASQGSFEECGVLAQGAEEEGDKIWWKTRPWWTTRIGWIYEHLARQYETKSWERYCVYLVSCDDVYQSRGLPKYMLPVAGSISILYLHIYIFRES